MRKGLMVVQSGPIEPAREDEYNDWYDNTHLPQVLAVPGFVAARRYRARSGADPALPGYLAIYEIEADDLTDPVKELRARSAAGEIRQSGAVRLDPPPVVTLYELME
ncbi:hypothetical protein DPM19_23935 [Actinomadura craniellae]|uniref:EthD family reductase n=1 Tax=Actinomadura craniellae TaxID=2231787 RepID=A0A365H0T5_9ACTN|nr:DUF4286 family protein [Actinomadura craniellae]RAY12648.1 hypothetical protein DPM19_23935 [Actinomadura craniellae]